MLALRRVLEIGSGSIKCQVARVCPRTHKIAETLFSGSQQTLFLNDLMHGKQIRGSTVASGAEVARSFLHATDPLGDMETVAVATEAFRQAANGAQAIADLGQQCGVPIAVLSEEKEARLGFESALGLTDCSEDRLVAWDCGAGSFQLTSALHAHFDPHGSGTALKLALREGERTPNPFDKPRLDALLNALHRCTKAVPTWFARDAFDVVAIGSKLSIFNQQRILSQRSQFGAADVERVLGELLGLDDRMLLQLERERAAKLPQLVDYEPLLENALYMVPKLALLLTVMRKFEMEQVAFHQTNGNCVGLLTNPSVWRPGSDDLDRSAKAASTATVTSPVAKQESLAKEADDENKDDKLLTVNWHLAKDCNYKCKFCFAHFAEVKENLGLEDGKRMLSMFRDAGFFKVNFAGGEPLLNANLGEFIKHAKEVGLKTSIITNASLMTRKWLYAYGSHLDQIGISCDSLDDQVNKEIGRGFGHHVQITQRALERIHAFNEDMGKNIKVKLNTVVTRQTMMDDWNDFIREFGVTRWKIFKILRVEGENDADYDDMAITDDEFAQFIERHQHLNDHGIVMAPEDNDDMSTSYVMVSPDGKFYQNTEGKYSYSTPILDAGVEEGLREVGFDYDKYCSRGGAYHL